MRLTRIPALLNVQFWRGDNSYRSAIHRLQNYLNIPSLDINLDLFYVRPGYLVIYNECMEKLVGIVHSSEGSILVFKN